MIILWLKKKKMYGKLFLYNIRYYFPLTYTIDTFKGVTPLVILLFIAIYSKAPYNAHENPFAWAYFGIHGSYGILWVLKNKLGFGDLRFHKKSGLLMNGLTMVALVNYWIPAYLVCTSTKRPPLYVLGLSVFLYANGVFWHFVSDMQKFIFIETKSKLKTPKNVLNDKLWAFSRNPNYFGELLIYASFALMSYHWLPFVTFGSVILSFWIPSMESKDESLSRFGAEFEEYKKKSSFWIPYIY